MTKHGSDKGRFKHNYTTVYWELFGSLRNRPLRIFELGLGTNNPHLASTMGVMGRPGASLRGWRQLFPKALVFGADIDRDILFTEDRIQTFYCDQLDSNAIRDLWAQPALQGEMDIIVDDGLHNFRGNASFLSGSLQHLRVGGVYIIEDITDGDAAEWRKQLSAYAKRFPAYDFALAELPTKNAGDNNLMIIRRQS
jgi:SAM-dependent methyltransferase